MCGFTGRAPEAGSPVLRIVAQTFGLALMGLSRGIHTFWGEVFSCVSGRFAGTDLCSTLLVVTLSFLNLMNSLRPFGRSDACGRCLHFADFPLRVGYKC